MRDEGEIRRAFEKANRNRGLTREQLRQFMGIASYHAQATLDFILPLLERNNKSRVRAVISMARAAMDGPDFTDGVRDVFSAAHVTGFPTPESVVGYRWILEACEYACENYTTPTAIEEPAVPVLQ